MKTSLALLLILLAGEARANDFRGVLKNNSGVAKFQLKNSSQALEDFTGALADLPYSSEVHYNIANSFMVRREYEKALSEYQQAIKNAPGDSRAERELKFLSYFNSAVAQTELKKVDEALDLYQKALDLKPDSLETKTNIELLTAQQSGGGDGDDKDQNKKDNKGKGKGKDDKDKDDKNDDKDKKDDKKKEDDPNRKVTNPRPSPRPFKSEELSQQDVKRILEELKRQEEQIRARIQNEQRKDAPPDKDW